MVGGLHSSGKGRMKRSWCPLHLLMPPSADLHHSGLDTKLPQSTSAARAMLLFSPKQRFDKVSAFPQPSLIPPPAPGRHCQQITTPPGCTLLLGAGQPSPAQN